jgi:alpha-ketoglutarate-dependent taurine dioxygenase
MTSSMSLHAHEAPRRLSITENGPCVYAAGSASARLSPFVARHLSELKETLRLSGAVLLRGFALTHAEEFAEAGTLIGGPLGSNYEGPSPRTYEAPGVYTASEVPGAMVVPEHAEMSYLPRMPRHLFFWCRVPAARGGETTIVDGRRVLARLDPERVAPLLAGPLLIRRRHARAAGLHDPFELKRWNETFGTEDRDELALRLRALGYTTSFGRDGALTLEHSQAAVRVHPETREQAWLNHLLVFHASTPTAILRSGARRERDPRALALYPVAASYRRLSRLIGHEVATDVRLCSGAPIADATVAHVREVVDEAAVHLKWQRGDVVLLDNHAVLHGRRPFHGERAVLVSWSDATA